jgi:hypothetical protein
MTFCKAIAAIGLTGGLLIAPSALAQEAVAVLAQEAVAAHLVPRIEVRTGVDAKSQGWWLRAATVVRAGAENWRSDEARSGYRISLQGELLPRTWIGVGAYGQAARFDADRGAVRTERHYAGARLSFEASSDVELGFAWLRRLRGRGFASAPGGNRGIKPGPKAYMQIHF